MSAVLDYLPRGNTLSDEEWHRRHRLLQWLLAAHIPGLFLFGMLRGYLASDVAETLAVPLACLILGHLMRSRRFAAAFVTLGLVYCSAALVGFSDGAIEAHFHFFVIIGFIALYQDWVPFLLNILFTVLSHGIGSSFVPDLMFNHVSAQEHPWEWSLIHGVAVLAACVGVVLFWKNTEDAQNRSLTLTRQLADAEISRRRFTSELLVNLARRNQNLLYRQLNLLNELEDKERDPDALSDLFRLDHLATRIRRNAENLLVLSGEESPRIWREPVQLADVVRAAIAEIEDLDRVDESVEETLAVSGRSVADLTHLFAELLENAVHFSPPGVAVVVRSRPLPSSAGTHLVTIEDWGVGMTAGEMAEANDILRRPREVDLSVSQRLGLHVVARLAQRYGISVELTATPGGGVTAVAMLPPSVFERSAELVGAVAGRAGAADGGRHLDPEPAYSAGGPAFDGIGTRVNGTAGAPGVRLGAERMAEGAPADLPPALPGRAGARPAIEGRRSPRLMPPLPPDPVDDVPSLPRRDPGEALAGNQPPTAEPPWMPRADAAEPLRSHRAELPEPFHGRAAGGDGAAQPGPPGSGHPGNGTAAAETTATGYPGNGGSTASGYPGNGGSTASGYPGNGGSTASGHPDNGAGAAEAAANGHLGGGASAAVAGNGYSGAMVVAQGGDGWSSWWTRATPPAQGDPRPDPEEPNGSNPAPLPEPRPPADESTQLRRRVPQAHLAAGLRREAGDRPAPEDAPVVRDPMAARNALSRFQAAQRAARDAVEGERGGGGSQ